MGFVDKPITDGIQKNNNNEQKPKKSHFGLNSQQVYEMLRMKDNTHE